MLIVALNILTVALNILTAAGNRRSLAKSCTPLYVLLYTPTYKQSVVGAEALFGI